MHFFQFFAVMTALVIGVTGCKKSPKGPTYIPGAPTKAPGTDPGFGASTQPSGGNVGGGGRVPVDPGAGRPVLPADQGTTSTPLNPNGDPMALAGLEEFEGMLKDTAAFAAYTVYFDFDKSAVKASEKGKIEEVAKALKASPADKLLVEGHCDDRGTEGYNLALGERRALSLREYLSNLGVGPDRVRTISYGEARPAVPGNSEDAWSKNRRGQFILLKPKPAK